MNQIDRVPQCVGPVLERSGVTTRVKSLRSSYTGLCPQTPPREAISVGGGIRSLLVAKGLELVARAALRQEVQHLRLHIYIHIYIYIKIYKYITI